MNVIHLTAEKNTAFVTYVGLESQADTDILHVNPTLAAGDVKTHIDDGAPANPGTLPAVDADSTKRVKVVLTAAETNGDNITVIFSDAAGDQWCDLIINIRTVETSKVLGLSHENIYIDNPVFDNYGVMTSGRVRIYSAGASVGTTSNVLATYTITSVGNGVQGQFTTWKQVKA